MRFSFVSCCSLFVLATVAACSSDSEVSIASVYSAAQAHCSAPSSAHRNNAERDVQVALVGRVFEDGFLAKCQAALEAGDCESIYCTYLFKDAGSLAEGVPCLDDNQCASARCSSTDTCGICKANSNCDSCKAGEVCTADGCKAPIKIVGTSAACDSRSICDSGLTCVDKACVAIPKAGEKCAKATNFDAPSCAANAYCNPSDVCTVKKNSGESCEGANECLNTLRCVSGKCGVFATSEINGSCKENVCSDSYCNRETFTCAAYKASGASCDDRDECAAGLACDGKTCTTPEKVACR